MFCGKCGAQNLENATFCKECGAPLNSTSSISTGSDMGELLVSTKTGAAGRKVLLCVLCPLLILLGIFIMATPEAFYELSHQHYRLIAILIGSVLIGYALFCLITTFLGSRSYCDVYENSVVGMTALSMNQPNMLCKNLLSTIVKSTMSLKLERQFVSTLFMQHMRCWHFTIVQKL